MSQFHRRKWIGMIGEIIFPLAEKILTVFDTTKTSHPQ